MPLLGATAGTYDLSLVLGNLLVIVVVARLAAEVAERVKVPPVLGEIVAGIVIGPSVLGWIDPITHLAVADMIVLLGEIGVILLLFQVGMEMDLAELGKVGRTATTVAIIGVAAPFAAGLAVASAFGESGKIALFIGAALTATSVGITARVLGDLRALATREARVVLGAAVADDVLGLVILTVVVKVVTEGSIGPGLVLETIGLAAGFLVVTGVLAIFVIPKAFDRIHRAARSSTTIVLVGFALTIAFSLLASEAKLAFIIGAFMAGLGIGRSGQHERIAEGLNPIGNVLIPVFFASIGINADLEAMVKPDVLALAACLTVVAFAGKLLSAVGVRRPVDRWVVGIGMVPRGEVGLIFASIGLSQGIIDTDLYGALLLMVLVTTVATPPILTARLRRLGAKEIEDAAPADEPAGDWFTVENGRLSLHGNPPAELVVPLALRIAELSSYTSIDSSTFDWFAAHGNSIGAWRPSDTEALVDLLRDGTPVSWRTLTTFGVLERALPEVGHTLERRRASAEVMGRSHSLTLPLIDRVHRLTSSPGQDPDFDSLYRRLHRPETLLLTSFVANSTDEGETAMSLARRISPDSADSIIRSLGLAEALVDASRGPDVSLDVALATVDDEQIVLVAMIVALFTTSGSPNSAIRQAVENLTAS